MALYRLCNLWNNVQTFPIHKAGIRPVRVSWAGQLALPQSRVSTSKRLLNVYCLIFIRTQTVEGKQLLWRKHQPAGWDMTTKQIFLSLLYSHSLHYCCHLLSMHISPLLLCSVLQAKKIQSLLQTDMAWTVIARSSHTGIFLPHAHKKLANSKLQRSK